MSDNPSNYWCCLHCNDVAYSVCEPRECSSCSGWDWESLAELEAKETPDLYQWVDV